MIRITRDPLDAAKLLQDFSRDRLDTGAVVSFTGLTRSRTGDRTVDTLTLEAYPGFTERVMEEIEADAQESVLHRIRELYAKSRTPEARCSQLAPDGQCCLTEIQRIYFRLKQAK